MTYLSELEKDLKDTFKLLNGLPDYIALEEKENIKYDAQKLSEHIEKVISSGKELGIKRLSGLINRTSIHYSSLSEIFTSKGFEPYASKVEVYRSLDDIKNEFNLFNWRSLEDSNLSQQEFKECWKQCMSNSDNAPTTITMEEHLNSVKVELGDNWKNACRVVYLNDNLIGMSIPHIEPGTLDEGRLFYFGIMPDARGKGHSVRLHHQSLYILKELGAKYYIGSTHENNLKMKRVFSKNGCSITARTESLYKYF
ncbi:GNAT family N-acetyltransferase [Pseudalkalibacillus berkeleyi]|uniref:GNAT family N-acetyltransferase n=1 Tax=Pseudalkalibacillus berkeleyi TaxID=1069813 RepID=A0ABS9H1L0_9BACL|nr:GNAT family N-acetyltransferase [Pseudalkalibacillus berkeleyi]MCF6137718.1 GNAT family N-acetyltransferase [Pseudalkalibacillus berkeleyi]